MPVNHWRTHLRESNGNANLKSLVSEQLNSQNRPDNWLPTRGISIDKDNTCNFRIQPMYPKVFVLQQLSEIVPISAIQSSRLLNLYRKMSVTRKFRHRVHEKMAVEMLYKLAF